MPEGRTLLIALAIGALAIVPVAIYGSTRGIGAGVIAAINVLLIILALVLLLGVWEMRSPRGS